MPDTQVAELEAHELAVRANPGQLAFGDVSAIRIGPDGLPTGVADHRRVGYAFGA